MRSVDDNSIGGEGAAKALMSNSRICLGYDESLMAKELEFRLIDQILDLASCGMGDADATSLAEALKTNATLQTLHLEGNHFGDEGVTALAKALETNSKLQALYLEGNNKIALVGIRAMAEALQTNSTLQVLVFRNVDMIDEGATALAQALKSNLSALQTLDLRSDGIWDRMVKVKGGEALAEALKTNATLQTLDLGGNRILCEGAEALAKALKVNSSLHTLGLCDNMIGNMGAMALAEALKVNSALQVLDLGSNEIETGAMALAETLKSSTRLQSLDMTDNRISSLDYDQIKRLFSHDETLAKRCRLLQDSPYDDQIYVKPFRHSSEQAGCIDR